MNLIQKGLVGLIRGYQARISPLSGPQCRFVPSCSEFTREAIERYGAARGLLMGIARLLKCHPWHAGGVDPVPTPTRKAGVH